MIRCETWGTSRDRDNAGHGRRMDGAEEREFAGLGEREREVLALRDVSGVEGAVGLGSGGAAGLFHRAGGDRVGGDVVLPPGDGAPGGNLEAGRREGDQLDGDGGAGTRGAGTIRCPSAGTFRRRTLSRCLWSFDGTSVVTVVAAGDRSEEH